MKKALLLILLLTSCYTTNPYYNQNEWEPCSDPMIEEGEPNDCIEEDNGSVV